MGLIKNMALIMFVASCTVGCQLLAKHGVGKIAPLRIGTEPIRALLQIIGSPYIVAALAIQGCGFAIWLTVLSRWNLTWAVGTASACVLVLTAVMDKLIRSQNINRVQIVGLAFLCLGAVLLSYKVTPSSSPRTIQVPQATEMEREAE